MRYEEPTTIPPCRILLIISITPTSTCKPTTGKSIVLDRTYNTINDKEPTKVIMYSFLLFLFLSIQIPSGMYATPTARKNTVCTLPPRSISLHWDLSRSLVACRFSESPFIS